MRKADIPQFIIDRVTKRRGKEHVFDDMVPAKTALIVVDLQNAFMVPEHSPTPVAESMNTIPDVNRLARAVRETGGKVFWMRHTVTAQSKESWSVSYALQAGDPNYDRRQESFMEGAPGHRLHPDLIVEPQDEIVLKYRFSAFIQGSSDLHERLQKQGYDTLLIVGTVTGTCCESTARDAMMLNYKTIMVSDGNSARTEHEHNAALTAFYSIFGDVMDTDMVIECLRKNTKAQSAA